MADLSGINDPTGGQMAKGFEPGEYTLMVVKSDMIESKNNPGNWYLECEFEIEGQPRRVWERFNLINANATAQEIAWRDWNSLCHACGKLSPNDSSEIHGIPFRARVGFEKGDPNKLKLGQCKPLASAGRAPTPGAQAPASGGNSAAPWKRTG